MDPSSPTPIVVAHPAHSPPVYFAMVALEQALRQAGYAARLVDHFQAPRKVQVSIRIGGFDRQVRDIPAEGYRLLRGQGGLPWVSVVARDDAGAMYGTLELAEQLRRRGSLEAVPETQGAARLGFRALKFNLPWSSYRMGEPMTLHMETCRQHAFWLALLDMMAVNRFNALTLWNLHPFPYMFRSREFPEACPFNDEEMKQWQALFRFIFRAARERAIEPYVVWWNIFVSPSFGQAHNSVSGVPTDGIAPGDTSELVARYNRQCVTQLIDEYDDLAGIGVSLGERMSNMTPEQRQRWIEDVVIAGMKAARRPVKFIHRAPFTADPVLLRQALDRAQLTEAVYVEYKFNWSHGHSTATLAITHDVSPRPPGTPPKIDDRYWNPPPASYRMAWMVRNEDFFILRWGEPSFIRQHIARNSHDYVAGYFVGSEGYVPAREYAHVAHPHRTWTYAFQRQWLFYMLWGRLLYDPATPDAVFEAELERRYGAGVGRDMLAAYALASRMPLRLASFHGATWDYTLYSEGFLAPYPSLGLNDGASPFISIDEFIDHRTLDPAMVNIPDYVKALADGTALPDGSITPPALADASEADSRQALRLVQRLRGTPGQRPAEFDCELDDLETWAHLGLYLADKIRGGVALHTYRTRGGEAVKESAVAALQRCVGHWNNVCRITGGHYQPVPYFQRQGVSLMFAWGDWTDQVERDVQIAMNA